MVFLSFSWEDTNIIGQNMSLGFEEFNAMRTSILFFVVLCAFSSQAEVSTYRPTDNAGMSKPERFDSIEKYMVEISSAVRNLEAGLSDNSKKIKNLEDAFNKFKLEVMKKTESDRGEWQEGDKKIEGNLMKLKFDIDDMNRASKILLKNDPKSYGDK
jgi:hypothetical protein